MSCAIASWSSAESVDWCSEFVRGLVPSRRQRCRPTARRRYRTKCVCSFFLLGRSRQTRGSATVRPRAARLQTRRELADFQTPPKLARKESVGNQCSGRSWFSVSLNTGRPSSFLVRGRNLIATDTANGSTAALAFAAAAAQRMTCSSNSPLLRRTVTLTSSGCCSNNRSA